MNEEEKLANRRQALEVASHSMDAYASAADLVSAAKVLAAFLDGE